MSVQSETVVFKKGIGIEKRTPGGCPFSCKGKENLSAETEEDADSVTVIYYYIL